MVQPGKQLRHRPIAFRGIAGAAEQLEVLEMVAAAFGARSLVVDDQVAEREIDPATGANAFLQAVEGVLVGAVVRQRALGGAAPAASLPMGAE